MHYFLKMWVFFWSSARRYDVRHCDCPQGVWLHPRGHKWLMETRLISRCKKVVMAVMAVSTFIAVAPARCFWGNKEVKAGKEHPVEPDGFYTLDRLFSLQAAISLINRLSLYLYLHLTRLALYISPPPHLPGVRHLYFPRPHHPSHRPSSSPLTTGVCTYRIPVHSTRPPDSLQWCWAAERTRSR